MSLQLSSMEDLFFRYLRRLTEESPFIRLNTDDSSTTINLGYECADKKKEISNQKFLPVEKYPIRIDFQELRTHYFLEGSTICTITKPTEMLLETKTKFEAEHISNPDILDLYRTRLESDSNNELDHFLATHRRVVLAIVPNDQPNSEAELVANVVLSTTPRYNRPSEHPFMAKFGKRFETCYEQIWWSLPREENFDFFILRKDTEKNTTICEIINKAL